jgi:histidinol-phosphate aminotransferase
MQRPRAVAEPQQEAAAATEPPEAADFVRAHLRQLKAYTPIEPFEILAQRLGREPKDIVKLDANENPYGPPPEVAAALGSMPFPHIYPDPESRRLRDALAAWHGVSAEHLLVRTGLVSAAKAAGALAALRQNEVMRQSCGCDWRLGVGWDGRC